MNHFYPLAKSSWDHLEIEAIHKVINTGMYSMGNFVAQCETNFSKFTKSRYCVMCSSGSAANLIMIASLFYKKDNPIKRGDEVIVPAVSWATTYFPLYQYGLKLKFVDIDIQTLNYDLDSLRKAITDKTRLVMCVNLLGNPNDFNSIVEMVKGKDIDIIEDNCESMGATLNNQQAGTFGLMGTYSSFFSHHISTMEGGFVVTDDEELYHILLCLRAHGWTRNLPQKNLITGTKSDIFFEEAFKFVLPGYNVRPLEMSGAIGIEQIKKLPNFIAERRRNAFEFKKHFANHHAFYIQKEIGESSWFGFSFVIKDEEKINRASLVQKLSEHGVECRPIVTGNFAKNEVLKWFDYEISGELKNAERIDKHGFFIGNHHTSMLDEIEKLRDVFDSCLASL